MLLLGLIGFAGSGKSEVGRYLVSDHGFRLVKFADGLKSMMRAFLSEAGVDNATIDRMIEGDLKEVPCDALMGKTPRHAMITLGKDWRDMIHPQLFMATALHKAKSLGVDRVVFDDLRYLSGAEFFKSHGGVIWRVQRPDVGPKSNHPSETETLDIIPDEAILNSGTIDDLHDKTAFTLALWNSMARRWAA